MKKSTEAAIILIFIDSSSTFIDFSSSPAIPN